MLIKRFFSVGFVVVVVVVVFVVCGGGVCVCVCFFCLLFYILVVVALLNLMLLQNKRKCMIAFSVGLMLIGKANGCSQRFFSLRSVASSLKKLLTVEKQNVSLQSTRIIFFI